jgi:hypothetical protein
MDLSNDNTATEFGTSVRIGFVASTGIYSRDASR